VPLPNSEKEQKKKKEERKKEKQNSPLRSMGVEFGG